MDATCFWWTLLYGIVCYGRRQVLVGLFWVILNKDVFLKVFACYFLSCTVTSKVFNCALSLAQSFSLLFTWNLDLFFWASFLVTSFQTCWFAMCFPISPSPPLFPLDFSVLPYHSNQYSLVYFVFIQRRHYSSFPESVEKFCCNSFFLPTPALFSFFLSSTAERTSSPQWQLIEVAHAKFHQFSFTSPKYIWWTSWGSPNCAFSNCSRVQGTQVIEVEVGCESVYWSQYRETFISRSSRPSRYRAKIVKQWKTSCFCSRTDKEHGHSINKNKQLTFVNTIL